MSNKFLRYHKFVETSWRIKAKRDGISGKRCLVGHAKVRQLVFKEQLAHAGGLLWCCRVRELRLQALLHVGCELCLEPVVEEADSAVIVRLLLGSVDVVVEAEAHGIVLLLSRSSSID